MSVRPHPNALTCTGALIDSLPSRTISFAAWSFVQDLCRDEICGWWWWWWWFAHV